MTDRSRRRIFVAGATGVIGRRLVRQLVRAGHDVTGTTRSPERAEGLAAGGVHPVVVDALDAEALRAAVVAARPAVVIHQLTDLATPPGRPIGDAELARTARLREIGTANVVAATVAAGARRLVAQSIGWLYAPGPEPHVEDDPLLPLDGAAGLTRRGVYELERLVTADPRFEGVVLRYGRLYGPDTLAVSGRPEPPAVHVDAAAHAAALAVDHGPPGFYNVADDGGPVANGKARDVLGWDPGWRLGRGDGDDRDDRGARAD